MRTTILALALVFTVLCASVASAQGTAHGISRKPFTQEAFAVACEKGDSAKLLNTTCDEVVSWLNAHRADLSIRDSAEMAAYIRTLNVVTCPVGKTTLNREVGGKILHEKEGRRWERAFAKGEMCLYDNNRAEVQFSLSCGNSPYEKLSVATAMVVAPTPAPQPPSAPAATPITDSVKRVEVGGAVTVEQKVPPTAPKVGHSHKGLLWTLGIVAVAGTTAAILGKGRNISESSPVTIVTIK
ncbi:MAG: hypothetical protein WCP17_01405 [bacterium]